MDSRVELFSRRKAQEGAGVSINSYEPYFITLCEFLRFFLGHLWGITH
jgi:hypothetical protein